MSIHSTRRKILATFVTVLAWAPWTLAQQMIGRVSATLGDVRIHGDAGDRKAAVAAPVYNGETVTTGDSTAASLLLDSQVVVKIDSNTQVRVVDSRAKNKPIPGGGIDSSDNSGTHLELGKGTVQVYLAKRSPDQGTVNLSDTIATIDATGTVFTASFSPKTRDGTYSCQQSSIMVHPAAGGPATIVNANQLARIRDGKLLGVQNVDVRELRSQTAAIQLLGAQSQQRSAKRSQQRADAASVRSAITSEAQKNSISAKQVSQLSDILLARCADLDTLTDSGLKVIDNPDALMKLGIDQAVHSSDGKLIVSLEDTGVPDGDVIKLAVRSCTDANLKTVADKQVIARKFREFIVHVEVPNIVEFHATDLAEGTAPGNGLGIFVLGSGKSFYENNQVFPDHKPGTLAKPQTIRLLVTKP